MMFSAGFVVRGVLAMVWIPEVSGVYPAASLYRWGGVKPVPTPN